MKLEATMKNVKVGMKIVDVDRDEGVINSIIEDGVYVKFVRNENCLSALDNHYVRIRRGIWLFVCPKCLTNDCPTNVPYSRDRDRI